MEKALNFADKLQDKPMTKKLTEACNCIKTWIEKNATEKFEREQALIRQQQKKKEEEDAAAAAAGETEEDTASISSFYMAGGSVHSHHDPQHNRKTVSADHRKTVSAARPSSAARGSVMHRQSRF